MLFYEISCVSLSREDRNSVTRCRNNVRGVKGKLMRKRKKCQKSATGTTARPAPVMIQSTDPKFKSNLDDNKQNFLRQFLKKSLFIIDLQAKSYRTDEYLTKLFYETARFSAFNHQWIVKAIINNSQRDVHQSNDRVITYQVHFMPPSNLNCRKLNFYNHIIGCIKDKDSIST